MRHSKNNGEIKMRLIAFVGPKTCGKDTCAAIAAHAGRSMGKISFAGPLKFICSNAFNILPSTFEHHVLKEVKKEVVLTLETLSEILDGMYNFLPFTPTEDEAIQAHFLRFAGTILHSPRHILQFVGTELMRAFKPSWHCEAAFSEMNCRRLGIEKDEVYCVTDCRFLNEYEFLNKHDTIFFYVERLEAEVMLNMATHRSELEILEVRKLIPNVIKNNGSLLDLRHSVLEVL